MLRTRDGYVVTMPRFRVRRWQRRLRTRLGHDPRRRAALRTVDLLIGRARRASAQATQFPVFTTTLGVSPVWIVTRVVAPRHVELLYIRHGPRRGSRP